MRSKATKIKTNQGLVDREFFIIEIKRLISEGHTQMALSKHFGIPQSRISTLLSENSSENKINAPEVATENNTDAFSKLMNLMTSRETSTTTKTPTDNTEQDSDDSLQEYDFTGYPVKDFSWKEEYEETLEELEDAYDELKTWKNKAHKLESLLVVYMQNDISNED